MTELTEPLWLQLARRDLGLRELPGAPTAPRIARWLQQLRAWWADDETPWCGTAMAAWMRAAGVAPPAAWYRAKAWADWGVALAAPVPGAVVVFQRAGGGHVGLVVGRDARWRLMVLGGNQGDQVCIAPFEPARVLAYRWPAGVPWGSAALPVIASAAASSTHEA